MNKDEQIIQLEKEILSAHNLLRGWLNVGEAWLKEHVETQNNGYQCSCTTCSTIRFSIFLTNGVI